MSGTFDISFHVSIEMEENLLPECEKQSRDKVKLDCFGEIVIICCEIYVEVNRGDEDLFACWISCH